MTIPEDHLKPRGSSRQCPAAIPASPSGGLMVCLAPLLVVWTSFLVRVVGLTAQGMWRDEVDQWRFAVQPLPDLLANFLRPGWNGPLYSPILRGWIAMAGDSVFAMRLMSVFWGVLVVALVWSLGRRLGGRKLAAISSLLTALSPYMVWYAQEVKMYTWVPMLVLLVLYALDRAIQMPKWYWWLVVLIGTVSAIYSHILAALLVPVIGGWYLLHRNRHRRAWIGAVSVIGGLTLPYLPLLVWQWPLLFQYRETGYPELTLGQMSSSLVNGWSAGIAQGGWGAASVPLIVGGGSGLLAVVGFWWWGARKRWYRGLQLLVWVVVPLLLLWVASQRGPIFTDRYLIWAAPAFYLLIAAGILAFARLLRPLSLLICAAWMLVSIHGLAMQSVTPIKPQYEPVVGLVEEQRRDGDLLLFQIPYNHHVFQFYSSEGLGDWAEAPYTNWRGEDGTYSVDAESVGRQMRGVVSGYDRVWLVYSEVRLWDSRELVKQWLVESYELIETRSYHGVTLLLFTRSTR